MPAPRRLAFVLAAAAAAVAIGASGTRTRAADDEPDGGASPGDLRTVTGKVTSVAWTEGKVTIEGADGPLTVGFNRDTTVFLDDRLGTMRDVVAGATVRAEYGKAQRAFWIEVHSRAAARADGGAEPADAGGGVHPVLPAPPSEADAGAAGPRDAGPRDAGTGSVTDPGPDGGEPPPAAPSEGTPPSGTPPTGAPTPPSTPEPPTGPGPVPGGPVRR